MDAAYLRENVGDVLADGLAAVILSNPPDKVEYLALWLLNYVEKQSQNAEAARISATIAAADAKHEQVLAYQQLSAAAAQKQIADAEAVKEQTITKALADAMQFEGVLEAFCERLKGITNASGVYIAERKLPSQAALAAAAAEAAAAEEAGAPPPAAVPGTTELLKYVAASEDNKFMIDQTLDKGRWVTWDLFEKRRKKIITEDGEEVDDPDELEAEAAAAQAAADAEKDDEELTDAERALKAAKKLEDAKKAVLELKTVSVGNLLMGENSDRIKFFKMPGTGSYHAVRVAYPALLNPSTLELVPKMRIEIAERNKKLYEAKEAAELAQVMSVLQPFGKPPKKSGGDEKDGGEDASDEDEKAERAEKAAAAAAAKKKKANKGKTAAQIAAEEEEEAEAEAKRQAASLGTPKPIDIDLEGFAAAATAAAEADAAQDAADLEDPDMEDDERAARKQKRTTERQQKLQAAEAMRKSVEEKQAAEAVMSAEQKEGRAKRIKSEIDAKNALELLEVIPKQTVEYALCLDTLNQNRRFSAAELAEIMKYSALLQSTLIRIDRQLFIDELVRRDALTAYSKENEKSAEDIAAEIEEKRQAWIKELKDHKSDSKDGKDEKKAVSMEDAAFKYRKELLASLRSAIAEFRTYNVFKGPLSVLQCLFYLLDYKQSQVAEGTNNIPDWKKMRMLFNDSLFTAIQSYDPTQEQVRGRANAYAKIKNLQKLLAGITYDQLKVQNYPLAELFAYISDAFKLKKKARDERKKAAAAAAAAEAKAKKEAEKKAAAEARAKAKADARAAAAAAGKKGKAAEHVDEDDDEDAADD